MDLSRYLGLFVTDSREHVARVEQGLVRVEEVPHVEERTELLNDIFRHLHSLKGSAATMGFEPIAQLAHHCEELIGEARQSARAPTAAEIDLLLQATDRMRGFVEAAGEERPLLPPVDLLERFSSTQTLGQEARERSDDRWKAPGPATHVYLRVSARSQTPAVRAFLAMRRLETLGRILYCEPSPAEVRAGALPGNLLRLSIEGAHSIATLREAVARLQDIKSVELIPKRGPRARSGVRAS